MSALDVMGRWRNQSMSSCHWTTSKITKAIGAKKSTSNWSKWSKTSKDFFDHMCLRKIMNSKMHGWLKLLIWVRRVRRSAWTQCQRQKRKDATHPLWSQNPFEFEFNFFTISAEFSHFCKIRGSSAFSAHILENSSVCRKIDNKRGCSFYLKVSSHIIVVSKNQKDNKEKRRENHT